MIEKIKEIIEKLSRKNRIRLAVFCARLVLPIWEDEYPNNPVCRKAIEAAERCIENDTKENRKDAYAAADAIACAAVDATACDVVANAAYAAYIVAYAASASASVNDVYAAADAAAKQGTEKKILEYVQKLLKEQGNEYEAKSI